MVGDPGLGKSQVRKECSRRTPYQQDPGLGLETEECASIKSLPSLLPSLPPPLPPSLPKMLQAAANVAPRGVYVCGNTTTASGLTVTLSKESGGGGGDYALEAGALVLADQGGLCVCSIEVSSTNSHSI